MAGALLDAMGTAHEPAAAKARIVSLVRMPFLPNGRPATAAKSTLVPTAHAEVKRRHSHFST